MKRRAIVDASALPEHMFGSSAPVWWGNLLMMVIEGFGFAILIAVYFYIRRQFDTWPPPRTAYPESWPFIANLIVMFLLSAPMVFVNKLAKEHAPPRQVGKWLFAACAIGIVAFVLRIYELAGLHTRWDSNAYGSIVWALLGMHLTHIIICTIENALLASVMFIGPVEEKDYVDATLNTLYNYFVTGSWVAVFLVVFVAVRFL